MDKEAAVIMSIGPTETLGQKGMKACVSIFDFRGEILFSSFQHIFLNQSAVVLMCFSLHNCFQNDAILERVSFWLRFLSTFSDKDDKYRPPVILVGTHLDKVPEKERALVKGKVLYRINKSRNEAKAYSNHTGDNYFRRAGSRSSGT
ncbi:uncharacterized protein LOC110443580 [Mizuhopecten yessoensis]|uniref:uncharacterized protein LOC110443580 n=1 Tax=Mizuhopecten yessoensis TaxID=6573 RepID=UPI000B45BAB2|nr:uncharacterized protein LOC110443580 [Mizuhopecten yessoensis]